MANLVLILSCVLIINYQVSSQVVRAPLGLLNRPYADAIIDSPRNYVEFPIESSRSYVNVPRIVETSRSHYQQPLVEPCINGNGVPVNIPVPNIPSTTIITDCTPSVCKNLADTINLMIVSSMIQNSKIGEQAAMQIAAPLLRDFLSNPAFIGNPNTIPNLIAPNVVAPNAVAPNFLPQNYYAPNLGGPNLYAPAPVAPRIVVPNSIAPTSNSPNAPINNGVLLSNLFKLLGGAL